jgi:hypothetical protein
VTPTNLGDLPTNLPYPNGSAQVKRGAVDSYTDYTTGIAYGTVFHDGAGGQMRISVTPLYPAFWLTTAEMLWWSPDVAWSRGDFGIRLSPADLDGRGPTAMARTAVAVHHDVPWRRYSGSMMWRLAAGITYTASMTWELSSGFRQEFSTAPLWHQLTGLLVGETWV